MSREFSDLERERRRLLRFLTSSRELAVGSVARLRRKCGNPRCGCLSGQGHPQTIFLFKDKEGRRRCKLIRRADEARLHKAGDRYRKWREVLSRLRAIENRQRQILLAEIKERGIIYK